ncbi:MAG TPA: ATP-dependent DNA helicase [Candidatus Paceibacterota bacterium]|nr:ATP-dependent DNA helicase [Candidatus Paceibacterota bacterium]
MKKNNEINFEKSYKLLNSAQKKAVDFIEGPVMVVAGPGTGKTTLLSLRIANILKVSDASPENILALTFTNSGVTAMRRKLIEYIGDIAYRVNIFTFHSFADNLIKEFSFYFKNLENANVISDLDKVKILEEIITENNLTKLTSTHDLFSYLNQIAMAIDDIKKEGLSPEQFIKRIPAWEKEMFSSDDIYYKRKMGKHNPGDIKPSEEEKIKDKIEKAHEIARIFKLYQEKLGEKKLYDFNDMILNVLRELESNQNLKLDLQEKYQYLLVDEHQDTNDGQNRLIHLLTDSEHLNGHPNLFTVGDEKQSIYRFQGASEESFRHFSNIYKDILVINLTENYRSTQNILDSAYSLINNSIKETPRLNSHEAENEYIKIAQFSNYKFELLFLADEISKKIKNGIDPSEIAVIYRSNKQVTDLKNIFVQNKIPHTILSKDNLLEDKNISNIINIIKLINDPTNNNLLAKVLFVDFLEFDSYQIIKSIKDFDIFSRDKKCNLFEFLNDQKLSKYSIFASKIKKLKTLSANSNFSDFFKEFLREIGYLAYMLGSDDGQDQILKLDKLFDEIKKQIESGSGYSISDFVKFIDSYQKYNLNIRTDDPEIIGGVNLMTAHKSKGLEFGYVYIINCTRNNWEKSRGINKIALPIKDYKGDVDDERRLFYVAMTRAKKELTITSSLTDWEGKEKDRSQFITEIDELLIKNIPVSDFEKNNINKMSVFVSSSKEKKPILDQDYIKNLFLNNNLSVTALNNYIDCPNKYLFRSLIKIPSEYKPEFVFGDIIHDSLENFFKESSEAGKILSKKNLIDFYKKNIKKSSLTGKDYQKYLDRGTKALSEYFDKYKKSFIYNVSTEKKMYSDFVLNTKNSIILSGILDKVEYLDSKNSGKINIIDYKTGKAFSDKGDKKQKEDLKRQLVFYHLLLDGANDDKFIINKTYLDFIQKNSNDDFERYEIVVSDSDKNDLRDQISKMANEILSGDFLKMGCNKKNCEYCSLLKTLK